MINVSGTLDDAYFEWLYSQIGAVRNRNPARSYWKLCRQLYTTEFTWFIPNDDNRIEDGRELRLEFLNDIDHQMEDPTGHWMALGCSMFEMLIALARRVAFETDRSPVEWFWRLMHNLELMKYTDELYEISILEEVEEVLTQLNDRTYLPDGHGGLFPLQRPAQDQREVELWYQMSAYLLEGHWRRVKPTW